MAPYAVKKVPKELKGAKIKQSKTKKSNIIKKKKTVTKKKILSGVIYIGHIPHGFYEKEMYSYFSQFGKILKLRIARSMKTGNSKSYGFIQFVDDEVAKIAANTMNNYLMFQRLIKCHYIMPDKVHPKTFHGRYYHANPNKILNSRRALFNKKKDETIERAAMIKFKKRVQHKLKILKDLGINYEIPFVKNEDFLIKKNDSSEIDSLIELKTTSLSDDENIDKEIIESIPDMDIINVEDNETLNDEQIKNEFKKFKQFLDKNEKVNKKLNIHGNEKDKKINNQKFAKLKTVKRKR